MRQCEGALDVKCLFRVGNRYGKKKREASKANQADGPRPKKEVRWTVSTETPAGIKTKAGRVVGHNRGESWPIKSNKIAKLSS